MTEPEKSKPRRIKIPEYIDLSSYKKLKSHWDWYWKHQHKDIPKKIVIDFDNLPPE